MHLVLQVHRARHRQEVPLPLHLLSDQQWVQQMLVVSHLEDACPCVCELLYGLGQRICTNLVRECDLHVHVVEVAFGCTLGMSMQMVQQMGVCSLLDLLYACGHRGQCCDCI